MKFPTIAFASRRSSVEIFRYKSTATPRRMSNQLYSELNVTKDNAIVEFGKLIIANRMNAQLKRQKMAGTSEAIYNPKVLAM